MTIANNYVPIRSLGNGVTTMFSASWSMISSTYAAVFLENASTGVQTPVTQGPGAAQYQIAITSSGFTVTFGTAPTASQYAVIGRTVPLDQTTPYSTSTGFQGKVEENSLDKLTAMIQQVSTSLTSAIRVPLGDTATNLVLPVVALRASGFLSFDVLGNVIIVAGVSSIAISSAMVPVVQATTLALARTAMGVPGLTGGNTFTGAQVMTGAALTVADQSLNTNDATAANTKFVLANRGPIATIQRFTSSGTYTAPAGLKWARVKMSGGGGGGGSVAGASNVAGGGGGAGGFLEALLTAAQLGASQTVTIGALGSGGASGGNNAGAAGGTTSLGSLLSCTGGAGGNAGGTQVSGGSGGTPTVTTGTTVQTINGGAGGVGAAAATFAHGGLSGSNALGTPAGAAIATSGAANGLSGGGNGTGGSGAANLGGATQSGGSGTVGIIIVEEYY